MDLAQTAVRRNRQPGSRTIREHGGDCFLVQFVKRSGGGITLMKVLMIVFWQFLNQAAKPILIGGNQATLYRTVK